MKDVAQDVAEDVTQDVAKDVLSAAEGGSVKVLILVLVIFQLPAAEPTPNTRMSPPALPLGDT